MKKLTITIFLAFSPTTLLANCLSVDTILTKSKEYNTVIQRMSKRYKVNSNLVKAVIATESCYNRKAISPAGAKGLMQLMPATARRFNVKDRFNSYHNIRGGVKYLSWLLNRFNGNVDFALAGYNAGEGRVDQYNGIPPYKETINYVRKVNFVYNKLNLFQLVLHLE